MAETEFDPYKVLGVGSKATDPQIKSAYRDLCVENAPDLVSDPAERAQRTKRLSDIHKAYGLIGTAEKRRKWDAQHHPARATADRIVETVRSNPRTDDFTRRVQDALSTIQAGRTPGTVPVQRPPRRPGPSTADARRTDDIWSHSSPRDRREASASDAAASQQAAEESIFRQAQNVANAIRKSGGDLLREGDTFIGPANSIYLFRHVTCGRADGSPAAHARTPFPILCRRDETFLDPATYAVSPGQNLSTARDATCRALLRDQRVIAAAVNELVRWRRTTAPMIEELAEAIRGDETVQAGTQLISRRDVWFSGESQPVSVLCIGDEVLELRAGVPVTRGLRYADADTLRWVAEKDNVLWLVASSQAKENGHPVSALNGRRARNTIRSITGNFLG